MIDVCTKAWGASVLSRNDANGVAKAALEESVQGHASAVDSKVMNVTDKTVNSMEDTNKATNDNATAIQKMADALLNNDRDAAASAKVLAEQAQGAASAAVQTARDANHEAAKPVVPARRARVITPSTDH